MKTSDINNHFGDMDLPLIDLILKGYLPSKGHVLDVGCGTCRNGLFFLNQNYQYTGIDKDKSTIQFLNHFISDFSNGFVLDESLETFEWKSKFEIIMASRVLHFYEKEEELFAAFDKLKSMLAAGGVLYVSMDSIVNSTQFKKKPLGQVQFPDGKTRLPLTINRYKKLVDGMQELIPLRTESFLDQHTQSFAALKKI